MQSPIAARLRPAHGALLEVHRTLLATERIAWEAINGRVAGNADFLQLAINDPWFAWLRPLTALIAAMDETMTEAGADAEATLPALLAIARELLHPDELGDDFQQRYFEFVQRSPDVAVAHGIFVKELANVTRSLPARDP